MNNDITGCSRLDAGGMERRETRGTIEPPSTTGMDGRVVELAPQGLPIEPAVSDQVAQLRTEIAQLEAAIKERWREFYELRNRLGHITFNSPVIEEDAALYRAKSELRQLLKNNEALK